MKSLELMAEHRCAYLLFEHVNKAIDMITDKQTLKVLVYFSLLSHTF